MKTQACKNEHTTDEHNKPYNRTSACRGRRQGEEGERGGGRDDLPRPSAPARGELPYYPFRAGFEGARPDRVGIAGLDRNRNRLRWEEGSDHNDGAAIEVEMKDRSSFKTSAAFSPTAPNDSAQNGRKLAPSARASVVYFTSF